MVPTMLVFSWVEEGKREKRLLSYPKIQKHHDRAASLLNIAGGDQDTQKSASLIR